MGKLMDLIHTTNPYTDFPYKDWPLKLNDGFGGNAKFFRDVVHLLKPFSIIEVGSWKGNSAISMANACKDAKLATELVCVDTWLGSAEFWLDRQTNPEISDHRPGLALKFGYPTVFYQFLANICWKNLTDYIVPFPVPSDVAAIFFRNTCSHFDLAYIDASHEYECVRRDIEDYVELATVLTGDDYFIEGVARAVNQCASKHGKSVYVVDNRYWRYV